MQSKSSVAQESSSAIQIYDMQKDVAAYKTA